MNAFICLHKHTHPSETSRWYHKLRLLTLIITDIEHICLVLESGFNQYLSYKLDFKIPWERNIATLLYILSGASRKWQLKKDAQSKLFECTEFWMNSTGKMCWKHRCWSRWEAGRHSPGCGLYFSLFCGTLHFFIVWYLTQCLHTEVFNYWFVKEYTLSWKFCFLLTI